jgi:ketosteroid isomerase-like protein
MNASVEAEISLLERAWMNAWVERDRATCERVLADDFLLTSARGVLMPKNEWLAAAMSSFTCTAFAWEELLVRPFGDTAIVHGRSRQQASVSGQDWSGVFLVTDVWARRNNQWQVVARHGTGPLSQ